LKEKESVYNKSIKKSEFKKKEKKIFNTPQVLFEWPLMDLKVDDKFEKHKGNGTVVFWNKIAYFLKL
jgi:hypothetical protein